MRLRVALAAALVWLLAAPAASAGVWIGQDRVVVTAPGGARAVIDRSPFRLQFQDVQGRTVLSEVSGGRDTLVEPPYAQNQFGQIGPAAPTLYAPLGFLVGTHRVNQTQAGQWEGTLQSVAQGGIAYSALRVRSATAAGGGARLVLDTSDPSGRRLAVTVAPYRHGTLQVSARPTPADGVATMADSFVSAADEAFRGFGGRHNAIDQRGSEFYNYLQQENVSSGSAGGLTRVTDPNDTYMFPNGPFAAYYVQSSFISSEGYGFLLDRDQISHWRLASDRPDAWQVENGAPAIDYVVAPAQAPRAIRKLTAITGRQPVPPRWAVGPILDRLVKFPTDPPDHYQDEVASDLRSIARYNLPLAGYRIEGWQFLPHRVLARFIARLRSMHIHPMLYFRAFVGQDEIGTDDPKAYDTALARGYVATHADGSPYLFTSNFNANAAQIDFTKPAAVRWWQGRVRRALDLGADGFMQDFGEQVLGDMHFHDGHTGLTMHNRLPVLYHRATRRLVERYERRHPGRRIYFFTRAGYTGTPGSATYEGANFPGDETTDWTRSSGLASQTPDMLNRAIGGAYGFTTDIGGFFDVGPYEPTTKELFLRWAEWAALSPLFRLHGSVKAGTHTPWSFDAETLRIYKRLTRLHKDARSLILRLWRHADRTGMPITRPLWLAYPHDQRAARQDQEWLLGPNVLVAPVVVEGATSREVYFPRGCWQSPEGGGRVQGPRSSEVEAPLERLPYFFRCGTSPFRVDPGSG
jgi:alpha-glucosidase (family GH31 glycosyl hydrolase)